MNSQQFNLERFKRQLAETILWCKQTAPEYRTVLPVPSQPIARLPVDKREQFIKLVLDTRRQKLGDIALPTSNELEGQLLIFYPDCTFAFDGVAQLESRGFFDFDNYPAYDTWVDYGLNQMQSQYVCREGEHYLISWVPPQNVKNVDRAIQANADESLLWLSDSRVLFEFLPILKHNNLT
jgi:hypothetical protein